MKKLFLFLFVFYGVALESNAFAVVTNFTPKKAAPVAVNKEATTKNSFGASFLPNVLNVASSVISMKEQQDKLTAECEPSSSDLSFVNNMIKEWAISGGVNPFDSSGITQCSSVDSYENSVRANNGGSDAANMICYDWFTDDKSAIWYGYPKASIANYCSTGDSMSDCAPANKKKATNLWTLYSMIPFDQDDFDEKEGKGYASLAEKADKCTPKKVAAARMSAMGGFVSTAINNVGAPVGTENVMQNVQSLMGKSGLGENISGLSQIAGSLLNR